MRSALRLALRVFIQRLLAQKIPERWFQNAALVEKGALPQEQYEQIRSRWQEIAGSDWVGQT